MSDKQNLIDSILNGYPIPLILFAEMRGDGYKEKSEIIDGMQRLNAIFTFIEHGFSFNGKYFDLDQFATARQALQNGCFTKKDNVELLPADLCSKILDYQLAVTIYPATADSEVTEVFGRINSRGRQLSQQEQRQAGVSNNISSLVRQLASEIRGDVSLDILDLAQMPSISIDNDQSPQNYGIKANDTIWCKQGILTRTQLRDSQDEQMILDIVASILNGEPIAASREKFDKYYNNQSSESIDLENKLIAYGDLRLKNEVIATFSTLTALISNVDESQNFLRNIIRSNDKVRNPIKGPFYALFMAIYDLVIKQNKQPSQYTQIINSIKGIDGKLTAQSHYSTTDERRKNISTIKGLIQDYFVDMSPSQLMSGDRLIIQVDNYLRRSKTETNRFETKQGFLSLDTKRKWNSNLEQDILKTACGIANLASDGAIIIGVCDSEIDAKRVSKIDGIEAVTVGDRYVVGIDREAEKLGIGIENYIQKIVSIFRNAPLTEPLKTQLLSSIDHVTYKGKTIIIISVQKQKELSFFNDDCYYREGPATVEIKGRKIASLAQKFSNV